LGGGGATFFDSHCTVMGITTLPGVLVSLVFVLRLTKAAGKCLKLAKQRSHVGSQITQLTMTCFIISR